MRVSAKHVIVELISAGPIHDDAVPVRELVRAAQAFGIAENSVRVAIVRLRSDGIVESNQRGQYLLGHAARPVNDRVRRWRDVEGQMVPWGGGWLSVYTGHLPRTDRPALRKRARALKLLGFRELRESMHVRPANLDGSVEEHRARLVRLGLEPQALVARIDAFAPDDEAAARSLWDTEAMRSVYKEVVEQLDTLRNRFATMPIEDLIRESFYVGREAIRFIVLDPLLPEPLVPAAERKALIDSMKQFDTEARGYWRKFMADMHDAPG